MHLDLPSSIVDFASFDDYAIQSSHDVLPGLRDKIAVSELDFRYPRHSMHLVSVFMQALCPVHRSACCSPRLDLNKISAQIRQARVSWQDKQQQRRAILIKTARTTLTRVNWQGEAFKILHVIPSIFEKQKKARHYPQITHPYTITSLENMPHATRHAHLLPPTPPPYPILSLKPSHSSTALTASATVNP